MKQTQIGCIVVLLLTLSASGAWPMLSFPEENEFHCRACHVPPGELTTADFHHQTPKVREAGCLVCHPRNDDGGLKPTERNCKACHVNPGITDPFTGIVHDLSPHHRSSINSECLFCHDGSSISNQPPDPFPGMGNPAPTPLVPEITGETVTVPVFMPGVPQTVGLRDDAYDRYVQNDCRTCHTPAGETTTGMVHHLSYRADVSGCVYCHVTPETTGVSLEHDCLKCHVGIGSTDPFTGSTVSATPHHTSSRATGGVCDFCHGTLVRTQGTGLVEPDAPQYPPSLVTPTPRDCLNCHNDGAIPDPQNPATNPLQRLHHAASPECGFCHDDTGMLNPIRKCESCHTITTLHSITGHTSETARCVGCHGGYLSGTPPRLELSMLQSSSTTDSAVLNITGIALSAAGLAVVTVNGSAVAVDTDGTFSHAVVLAPGTNTITIVATGADGKTTEETREITYADSSATLSITAPADNSVTPSLEIVVEGTAQGTKLVKVTHNGKNEKPVKVSGGRYVTTVNLIPGMNTIEVSVAGTAKAAKKRTVYYRPDKPALAVSSPAQDAVVTSGHFIINGAIPDGGTITIVLDGEETGKFAASGDFTFPIRLKEEKAYELRVQGVDAAGRMSEVRRNIMFNAKNKARRTQNPLLQALRYRNPFR